MIFLFDQDVPEDCAYSLETLGHRVVRLREVLPTNAPDEKVFQFANENGWVLITCIRDDFLSLIGEAPFAGLIVLVRRRNRALERSALVQLIQRCGDAGLQGAIHFA